MNSIQQDARDSRKAWGRTAVIVGAGVAGLSAAAAIRGHFDRTIVLERDRLPETLLRRPSVPQAAHVHVLLAGGLVALEQLMPGVGEDLSRAGAVRLCIDRDLRVERAPFDPLPARDCGFYSYALSRPLLEQCLRDRVRALTDVEIRDDTRVFALLSSAAGDVRGVRYACETGDQRELEADLVVDCSGRSELFGALIRTANLPEPPRTRIGIELMYSSATFEQPRGFSADWKAVVTLAQAPVSSAGGLLAPIEGDRWIVSLSGRHAHQPGGDSASFADFARTLRTPTIAQAIDGAALLDQPARFAHRESVRLHIEAMSSFPVHLVVLGDASCRFNPIYGQGMSIAAQQACALGQWLQARSSGVDPWQALAGEFRAQLASIVDAAWGASAIPDLQYPETVGARPNDLPQRAMRSQILLHMAAQDAEINRMVQRVQHLLDSPAVLFTPEFRQRMAALIKLGKIPIY